MIDDTSTTPDPALAEEAHARGVDAAAGTDEDPRAAVDAVRAEQWQRENAEAIRSYNEWIAENDLPLTKYRRT